SRRAPPGDLRQDARHRRRDGPLLDPTSPKRNDMTLNYGYLKGKVITDPELRRKRRKRELRYHLHVTVRITTLDGRTEDWDTAINVGTRATTCSTTGSCTTSTTRCATSWPSQRPASTASRAPTRCRRWTSCAATSWPRP